MLVTQTADGWEIIYHRAHALLAAQLAGGFVVRGDPLRIAEIIVAIGQHDDLAREWEGELLTPAGAPLDFTLSTSNPSDVAPWQELIEGARYRSRWVALLTAMHIAFLCAPRRAESAKLARFLDDLAQQQAEWRSQLGVSKAVANRSYQLMQWCDRMSLILVQQQLPTRSRWLEIATLPDGSTSMVKQRDDGSVVVKPWPFQKPLFVAEIDVTVLDQITFATNAALVTALKRAPIITRRWEFSRQPLARSAKTTPAAGSE